MLFPGTTAALFLSTLAGVVHGTPHFFVNSGKPRCFAVEVPRETTIQLHYEAPDIDTATGSVDYAPTFITILEKAVETVEEQRLEHANDAESLKARRAMIADRVRHNVRPVSKEITETAGSFTHTMNSDDAVVEVCVRASNAGKENPMMFHLRVEELEEDVLDAFQQEKAKLLNSPPLVNAEHHWSFMETQLNRIDHEMKTITREADFFRERDALYHQQTDDLHKATLFWPMLHCCILALTGFTQANHIISFFKHRRII